MSYVVQRSTGFAGYYRDKTGRRRSVGIYPSKKEAQAAAAQAEAGILIPQRSGGGTLRDHIQSWLPTARDELMPSTLAGYERAYETWVLPALGDRAVASLTRKDVEAVIREAKQSGVAPSSLANIKAAVGRAMRPLVPDIMPANPAHGIRINQPPRRKFDLLRKEEFDKIHACLPTEGAQLFVEFLWATGCRFGEAIEIRRADFNSRNMEINILRRATEVNGQHRYQVVAGTKAGQHRGRTVRVPSSFMNRLEGWCEANAIGPGDLVFSDALVNNYRRELLDAEIKPGKTFVSGRRRYQHGTVYAYSSGACRCGECRSALRAYRRRNSRKRNDTGHLSHSAWRKIWNRAVKEAAIGWYPRTHDLRHAYASYLLENGISLVEVMEYMGHHNLSTTQVYLHRVESERSKVRDVIEGMLN